MRRPAVARTDADMVPHADPSDPEYTDEVAARAELTRVFTACRDCRACVDECGVFPRVFDILDRIDDGDPGRMTPAEQDDIVDRCVQCDRCVDRCPFADEPGDSAVRVPAALLRAEAMRRAAGHRPVMSRVAAAMLARRGGARIPVLGRLVAAPVDSLRRRVGALLSGISAERSVGRVTRRRPRATAAFGGEPTVTVVPTCVVTDRHADLLDDVIALSEAVGMSCSVADVSCCGAGWLHSGDVARFRRVADANLDVIAGRVRAGDDIAVADATCRRVIATHYPAHCSPDRRVDAELLAGRVRDVGGHLVDAAPVLADAGLPARAIVVEAGAPASSGASAADLLRAVGVEVDTVAMAPPVGGWWSWRAAFDRHARVALDRAVAAVGRHTADAEVGTVVVSDSMFVADALAGQLGRPVEHPVSVVRRARDRARD